jgi:hypothetical protein
MSFLSARDTPIARRFEIWAPTQEQDVLVFQSSDWDQSTELATDYKTITIAKGEGTIGQVWLRGVAAVHASLAEDTSAAGRSAAAAGLNAMVALPIMDDQGLKAVVAWYF